MRNENITLRIKNNANVKIPIEILGGQGSDYENIDTNTLVQWDLTTEDYEGNQVTINTTPIFNVPLEIASISGVADALNSLNIATFFFDGTILYAVNLINSTVSTATIEIDNIAWDIDGWINNETVSQNLASQLINGVFSSSGNYLFLGDLSTFRQDRRPLSSAWDIQTIGSVDQFNTSFNQYAVFSNSGLFRYKKSILGATWQRQPLGTAFDLNTIGAIDQTNGLTVGDFIYFLNDGSKFYGITGSTLSQYVAASAHSILAPSSLTTRTADSFLPNDGLGLKGIQFSSDGTKMFVLKSGNLSPFTANIYQCTCSTPNDMNTAIYDNVSVSFQGLTEVLSMQFRADGKRFFTIEGVVVTQRIREFG